jgi:hypothetical protein
MIYNLDLRPGVDDLLVGMVVQNDQLLVLVGLPQERLDSLIEQIRPRGYPVVGRTDAGYPHHASPMTF